MNLFGPDNPGVYSQPFQLKQQMTVFATGFNDDTEFIEFEIVTLSEIVTSGPCCPGAPVMPAVADATPLMCGCVPVKLSIARPFVIIDAPQGAWLRAHLVGDAGVVAEAVNTDTKYPSDSQRGCGVECVRVWMPTLELPCGTLAFRITDDRDPEATVELRYCPDESGNGDDVFGYIYPTPTPQANVAVVDCANCDINSNVIGYGFPARTGGCNQ